MNHNFHGIFTILVFKYYLFVFSIISHMNSFSSLPNQNNHENDLLTGPNVCSRPKKLVIDVQVTKPVECTNFEKILSIFNGKCKKEKIVSEPRTIETHERYCCPGYIRVQNKCVPFCQDSCVHGHCVGPNQCLCDPGYSGKKCLYACTNMTWGPSCNHKCNCPTLHSHECDPENGECICLPGWMGKDCSLPCPGGFYGSNCSESCNCDLDTLHLNRCDRFTGKCLVESTRDCSSKPGFHGDDCQQQCPNGKHGPNCKFPCNKRCESVWAESSFNNTYGMDDIYKLRQRICHPVNGHCSCPPGRIGKWCQNDCDFGTFGLGCTKSCECSNMLSVVLKGRPDSVTADSDENTGSEKENSDDIVLSGGDNNCNPVTGQCQCSAGYSGTLCQSRFCPSGTTTFDKTTKIIDKGKAAHEICNTYCNCSNDDSFLTGLFPRFQDCHPLTGACQCGPGWTGPPDCDVKCPLKKIGVNMYRRTASGFNCDRRCRCGPKNGENKNVTTGNLIFECHPITGECICPPGFYGKDCENVCSAQTYGINCNFKCTWCNGKCNPFDGTCSSDKNNCPLGFFGTYCTSRCDPLHWGKDCSKQCTCLNDATCDQITGKCLCKPGYSGLKCEEPCLNGYYGWNCSFPCNSKHRCPSIYSYSQDTCDKVNGLCVCGTPIFGYGQLNKFNDLLICGDNFNAVQKNFSRPRLSRLLWIILIPVFSACLALVAVLVFLYYRKRFYNNKQLEKRFYDDVKVNGNNAYELDSSAYGLPKSPMEANRPIIPYHDSNFGTARSIKREDNDSNLIPLNRGEDECLNGRQRPALITYRNNIDMVPSTSNKMAAPVAKENNIIVAKKLNHLNDNKDEDDLKKDIPDSNYYSDCNEDPYYVAFTTKKNFAN